MRVPLRRKPIEIELPRFGISAFSSRHAPSFEMPFTSSPYHKLCFVEEGEGGLEIKSKEVKLATAALVHIPPLTAHRFTDNQQSPMTLSALCFDKSAFQSPSCVLEVWNTLQTLLPAESLRTISFENDRNELRRLFGRIVLEMGREQFGRAAVVFSLSTDLLVLAARSLERQQEKQANKIPNGIAASLAVLDDKFTEDVRIEELAKMAKMSYRAYTENFRKYTGMTVMQYVTLSRLEFAKRRMLETEDILGSSLEAGYQDLSHFYRLFKRQFHETPQAYINRHMQEKEHA